MNYVETKNNQCRQLFFPNLWLKKKIQFFYIQKISKDKEDEIGRIVLSF